MDQTETTSTAPCEPGKLTPTTITLPPLSGPTWQLRLLQSAAVRFRISSPELAVIRNWRGRSEFAVKHRELFIVAMRDHWRALGAPIQPSFPAIGAVLGAPNHSSVITAYKRAKEKMAKSNISFTLR